MKQVDIANYHDVSNSISLKKTTFLWVGGFILDMQILISIREKDIDIYQCVLNYG